MFYRKAVLWMTGNVAMKKIKLTEINSKILVCKLVYLRLKQFLKLFIIEGQAFLKSG